MPYTVGARSTGTDDGLVLDIEPVSTLPSGHNTFLTPRLEGFAVTAGKYAYRLIGGSAHNLFLGGDGVSADKGLYISADSALNHFINTVFESNNTKDIDCYGYLNVFTNAQAFSAAGTTEFYSGAQGNRIVGGRYRAIQVDAGAIGTDIDSPATYTVVTDNGTGTQQRGVYEITSNTRLATRINSPSAPSSSNTGFWGLYDNADKARAFRAGIDNTLGVNGVAWFQSVRDAVSFSPLQLQPGGGSIELGGPLVQKRAVLAYGVTVSPNTASGNFFDITATNGTAFTIAFPVTGNSQLGVDGQQITFTILNTSLGALGAVTWTGYKMAAWVSPATGFNRSITFRYNSTSGNWHEISRTAADVPN